MKKDALIAFLRETLGDSSAAAMTRQFKMTKSELAQLCQSLVEGRILVDAEARLRLDRWAPAAMQFDEPRAIAFDASLEEDDDALIDAENAEDEDAAAVLVAGPDPDAIAGASDQPAA